jgi:hypothetical protein
MTTSIMLTSTAFKVMGYTILCTCVAFAISTTEKSYAFESGVELIRLSLNGSSGEQEYLDFSLDISHRRQRGGVELTSEAGLALIYFTWDVNSH